MNQEQSPTLSGAPLVAAIFVLAMANFMAVLDMTIVNVAIPHIAGSLAVSNNEGTWAITSYSIAEAVTVPLTGWLAQRFGAVRVFVTAALGFGLFSAICGLSISLPMLVICRVAQGLMGGPLMPMSQTLLLRVSPPEHRNIALGLWTMTTILGPIAGPLVSGGFSDSIGWPWAFYINVPISLICATLAWRMLKSRDTERVKNPVDYAGLGLLILWVGALQIMLDNGQDDDWFKSSYIVTLAIVAAIGFLAFLIWETTEKNPIVDLRVFRHRGFAVSAGAMLLVYGSFFGSIVLIPLWLQSNMGYTATSAGEVMAFNGVFGVIMAPIAALLISRVDPRMLLSFGLTVIGLDTLYRTTFNQDMGFLDLVPAQLALGIGMPFFFVPLMSMSMAAVKPEETASAAGLINFLRTFSGAIATSVVTSAWADGARTSRTDLVANLHGAGDMLGRLKGLGLSGAQALARLDGMADSQSIMLATNHLFFAIALIVFATAVGVWLMPKPSGPVQMGMGGH